MEQPETHIEKLLDLLHSWVPLSNTFRIELTKVMHIQKVQSKQELFEKHKHINTAWFSVDCWVIAYQDMLSGTEEVIAIYRPGEILTDLTSFLLHKPTRQRLIILEGTQLLSISKQAYFHLRLFPETPLLLEHYLLLQHQQDQWRMNLLALNDTQKVVLFAEKFPVNELPGHICASFLRMTQPNFSTIKANYNRTH